jgi:hypothetical protein
MPDQEVGRFYCVKCGLAAPPQPRGYSSGSKQARPGWQASGAQ